MKIAIVGTGAMGSVYAGLLRVSGHEVWAIDIWEEHIKAIRNQGLRVSGASGNQLIQLPATTNAQDVGICDYVIIATKAMDVKNAAHDAKALIGSKTTVVTIQNGLGSADIVRKTLCSHAPIVGVVGGFGASIQAPGHAHHHGWELVRFGEMQGPSTDRVENVAKIWRAAGFKVTTYDNITRMIWDKLICNTCFSGTCAVTNLTVGEVMGNEHAWMLAKGLAKEAYNVAIKLGIDLQISNPIDHVTKFGQAIPGSRPSLLLDHMAERPAEIDYINGAVVSEGRRAGVRTPYNDEVVALLKVREMGFG